MTSTVSLRLIGLTVVTLNRQTGGSMQHIGKYQVLFPKSGNILVCPISLEALMALVQVGANGDTATQISLGLNLPVDKRRILDVYSMLYTSQSENKIVARKIYVHKDFKMSDQYNTFAVDNFQSEIEYVNLLEPSKAIRLMNEWIETKAYNLVGNHLISEQSIQKETQMVLFNIMYTHGLWETSFSQKSVGKEAFFIDKEHFIDIDMIEIRGHLNYYVNTELRATFLEIPCGGGTTSFTIVLPDSMDGLPALENYISKVIRRPHYKKVAVHALIPTLKVHSLMPFVNILQTLGIVKPFEDNADLNAISEKNEDRLKIADVLQEVYGDIKQSGEVSDAALNMGFARSSPFAEYATFQANHPFIFYLKDEVNGISFIGRFIKTEGEVKPTSTRTTSANLDLY